jgi:hypothetical protein
LQWFRPGIELSRIKHMFVPSPAAGVAAVQEWTHCLQDVSRTLDDVERIDMLRALEELMCAAAGAHVVVTADFGASQRAEQAALGVPVSRQGRGVPTWPGSWRTTRWMLA